MLRATPLIVAATLVVGASCSVFVADYSDGKIIAAGSPDSATTTDPEVGGGDTNHPDTFVAWTAIPCSSAVSPTAPAVVTGQARVRYPSDKTQSPMTPYVASNILRIATLHPGRSSNVFMKVGDSNTVNGNFLTCFTQKPPYSTMSESDYVNLDTHTELRQTIDYFAACVAGTTPFERVSLAAAGGTGSGYPLSSTPTYLDQEIAAMNPQFAIVMYGTNDLGNTIDPGNTTKRFGSDGYPHYLLVLVDAIIDKGIVPILTTIPPKTTSPEIAQLVPTFNDVVRGIAEARQIPLVDWNREMQKLPGLGLGGDGTHPIYEDAQSCNLAPEKLAKYAFNVRNLITLEALERVRKIFVEHLPSIDIADPTRVIDLTGTGAVTSPFAIDQLPFTDIRDQLKAPAGTLSSYSGCPDAPPQPGNEQLYKLVITTPTPMRAFTSQKNAKIPLRLNLMRGTDGASCLASDKQYISRTLAPGTYYLSVDSEAHTETTDGDYIVGVVQCEPGDASCN